MLVTGVREADAIAISEEQAGGTDHPTGQVGTVALA
jgi:hypothetical protein